MAEEITRLDAELLQVTVTSTTRMTKEELLCLKKMHENDLKHAQSMLDEVNKKLEILG